MQVDGNRFRRRRFARFLEIVDSASVPGQPVRIIDIGGRATYWDALRPLWAGREFHITLVNVEPMAEDLPSEYVAHTGDACALPEFADNSFDVVHSNSVIEHVGQWPRMRAMANEVRRLAPHHFIQTPYFGFPVEPHFRAVGFHWLPEGIRAARLAGRTFGFRSAADFDAAMEHVQSVNLLTARQMAALFPDSSIVRERIGPVTKSLIALR